MLIIQTLTVTEAYFAWPYGEVYYGVGLVVLLLMMTADERPLRLWSSVAAVAICVFLITGHPLVFPCLLLGMTLLFGQQGLYESDQACWGWPHRDRYPAFRFVPDL